MHATLLILSPEKPAVPHTLQTVECPRCGARLRRELQPDEEPPPWQVVELRSLD
jgi:hypothetical protein